MTFTAYGWLGPNQATPSLMRAKRSRYDPGVAGTRTVALTAPVAAGATSDGSGLRMPSQTTVFPAASYQWYESAICPLAGKVCGAANLQPLHL